MFRILPPSGIPIRLSDIFFGIISMCSGKKAISRFNQDVCRKFGVRHTITVSSGRVGLSMLFRALQQLHPGRNQVLIPAFTSFSVPAAVVNAGLRISLYDIDPITLSPSCSSLENAITDETLCIVVCHLFGFPADMDAVMEVAHNRNIPLVDDAAQAMGAKYRGKMVGTFGVAGLFSLSRGKNITAVDGGIIVTNDDLLAKELKDIHLERMKIKDQLILFFKAFALSFFMHPRFYWFPKSISSLNIGASVFDPHFIFQYFTAFQAGIAQRMLSRLDTINIERKKIAKKMIRILSGNNKVKLPQTVVGGEPVFLRLPVRNLSVEDIDITELGIVRTYPAPIQHIFGIERFLDSKQELPGAILLSEQIITFPTHCYVMDNDYEKIRASML